MKKIFFLFINVLLIGNLFSQTKAITVDDTLFGSNHAQRLWWDVKFYNITVKPDFKTKLISGSNIIKYSILSDSLPFNMQIDLQEPLMIDSIFLSNTNRPYQNFKKEKNRWIVSVPKRKKGETDSITLFFSGKPHEAKNAPWDGGWVWNKDSLGSPWMSVACQGNGPSIWYPCKDLQSDEPDNGCKLNIITTDTTVGVGNGKLIDMYFFNDSVNSIKFTWSVTNPINNYNIIPYLGNYTYKTDTFYGEKGKLLINYFVLTHHKNKITTHLKPQVQKMLKCFEHWFGPYPFYEDSYKIVETPYLGMEHQSNIAYGNRFVNGYLGRDLSNTGWGLKWDFIIIHESGHEWFGNSVTAHDVADNWIHEGFTSYSEVLFTECEYGKEAGNDYCVGVRKSIENDIPVIGKYGVHKEGSGDMYNKGSQVVHMIRQIINDDEKFRMLLRDINKTYYHKTVTTKELETFICEKTGIDFMPLFNQYLRTVQIPKLECKLTKAKLQYRYSNCITGFNMPVKILADKERWIYPTAEWQTILLDKAVKNLSIDRNFYIELSK